MIRKIIEINVERCNGCGLCAAACHEGAIGMVDGVATLLRDDYCDGLGDCLPVCPTGAIEFVEREASAYDEAAVMANIAAQARGSAAQAERGETAAEENAATQLACGCPGTASRVLERAETPSAQSNPPRGAARSELRQWPVQLRLVPTRAPYFDGARLLVAADCAAYAHGNFHEDFIAGRVVLIGCPKLDAADYAEKLTAILRENNIKSVTVLRMEVPCCGGLEHAVAQAVRDCGRAVPWRTVTLATDGDVVDDTM